MFKTPTKKSPKNGDKVVPSTTCEKKLLNQNQSWAADNQMGEGLPLAAKKTVKFYFKLILRICFVWTVIIN